jgi:hypothetical protein
MCASIGDKTASTVACHRRLHPKCRQTLPPKRETLVAEAVVVNWPQALMLWPNGESARSQALSRVAKSVPPAVLSKFLLGHVSRLSPGDAALTEERILGAAQEHFSGIRVSRKQVRDWMRTNMPPEKRFPRGYKPICK